MDKFLEFITFAAALGTGIFIVIVAIGAGFVVCNKMVDWWLD